MISEPKPRKVAIVFVFCNPSVKRCRRVMQNHWDSHSKFLALKPFKLVWSICMYTWTNAHDTLAPDISQEIGTTTVNSEYCAFFKKIDDFAICRYCFVIDESNHPHI